LSKQLATSLKVPLSSSTRAGAPSVIVTREPEVSVSFASAADRSSSPIAPVASSLGRRPGLFDRHGSDKGG
jgi:hypothetical protein